MLFAGMSGGVRSCIAEELRPAGAPDAQTLSAHNLYYVKCELWIARSGSRRRQIHLPCCRVRASSRSFIRISSLPDSGPHWRSPSVSRPVDVPCFVWRLTRFSLRAMLIRRPAKPAALANHGTRPPATIHAKLRCRPYARCFESVFQTPRHVKRPCNVPVDLRWRSSTSLNRPWLPKASGSARLAQERSRRPLAPGKSTVVRPEWHPS
jgi:hypothetical protein